MEDDAVPWTFWRYFVVLVGRICSVSFSFKGIGFVGVCASFRNVLVYVYAPCSLVDKRKGWEELKRLKLSFDRGEWCVVGDFNFVTSMEERKGRSLDGNYSQDIAEFNSFIVEMEFIDVVVSGRKFSWFFSDGVSMSRLDRFLITDGLLSLWNVSGKWIGDRDISDHCPIWLIRSIKDSGPKPFLFINGLLKHSDFRPFVSSCWAGFGVHGNKAYMLKEKFKMLKAKLRSWSKEVLGVLGLNIENVVNHLNMLDDTLIASFDPEVLWQRKET